MTPPEYSLQESNISNFSGWWGRFLGDRSPVQTCSLGDFTPPPPGTVKTCLLGDPASLLPKYWQVVGLRLKDLHVIFDFQFKENPTEWLQQEVKAESHTFVTELMSW